MAKPRKQYICQECGAASGKWIGRCPSCGNWNTYVEEVIDKGSVAPAWVSDAPAGKVIPVNILTSEPVKEERIPAPGTELNRVLGGGIVRGSLILLGGEPGIGKSTLMLQTALKTKRRVLYVSGEESENQIKMRAERIGIVNENCFVLPVTELDKVFAQIKNIKPELVIIDSIQTLQSKLLDSAPGSISQVRECTSELLRFAKESNTPVFLIGHITKEGQIAGPKVLEHMVDTVLQFEGDRHHTYRILRGIKNRFGSASELGIYEMIGSGLREVSNPSEILISQRDETLSGVTICAVLEGVRPLLVETQALVSTAAYGTPQRNANGFDLRRLNMLLAVLEKRCGFRLSATDVFVNIAGGLKIDDPGADLSLACAVLSSYENIPVSPDICLVGEIGLSGEIRAVSRMDQRIAEAKRLGFSQIIISKFNQLSGTHKGLKIVQVGKIDEVFTLLFG